MYYTIRNGIFIKEADTSGLTYTVDGLIAGTEYGFIIQAWVNGEYSVLDKSDAVYFIPEKELTIEDYIEIVNSIPDDEDSVILTDEQIEAIEKVLEYDYSK